DYLCGRQSLF
ncbi:yceG-like family protein, partial [Vibrio harveyi]